MISSYIFTTSHDTLQHLSYIQIWVKITHCVTATLLTILLSLCEYRVVCVGCSKRWEAKCPRPSHKTTLHCHKQKTRYHHGENKTCQYWIIKLNTTIRHRHCLDTISHCLLAMSRTKLGTSETPTYPHSRHDARLLWIPHTAHLLSLLVLILLHRL